MFDSSDVVLGVLAGAIAAFGGLAFRALPAETRQRWKLRFALICGTATVLALVVMVKLFIDYRP